MTNLNSGGILCGFFFKKLKKNKPWLSQSHQGLFF